MRKLTFEIIMSKCSAKILFGEVSFRQKFRSTRIPFGEISFRRKFRSARIPSAKIQSAKIPSAKIPDTPCPTADASVAPWQSFPALERPIEYARARFRLHRSWQKQGFYQQKFLAFRFSSSMEQALSNKTSFMRYLVKCIQCIETRSLSPRRGYTHHQNLGRKWFSHSLEVTLRE